MYAPSRSCNADLRAGITDGGYKKAAMNRGGVVESTFVPFRQQMSGVWHGFNEKQQKVLPNGTVCTPPYYYDVTPEDDYNV